MYLCFLCRHGDTSLEKTLNFKRHSNYLSACAYSQLTSLPFHLVLLCKLWPWRSDIVSECDKLMKHTM